MIIRKKSGLLFFFIIIELILLALACWQLYRLDWKNKLIQQTIDQSNKPAIDLLTSDKSKLQQQLYRKVQARGYYDHKHEIHLFAGGRLKAKEFGYLLLTPLILEDGTAILVNRGFISSQQKEPSTRATTLHDAIAEIEGILMKTEQRNKYVPENDLPNNIWYSIDVADITKHYNIQLLPYYILLQKSNELALEQLVEFNPKSIQNHHLMYAITWFGIAVGIALLYVKKYDERQ